MTVFPQNIGQLSHMVLSKNEVDPPVNIYIAMETMDHLV